MKLGQLPRRGSGVKGDAEVEKTVIEMLPDRVMDDQMS
jgi:hypothetical protein